MTNAVEKKGKVYLVGAGPGDPGLLTVKASQLLEKADVVVYDYLANPALLRYVSPDAELIYVGKTGSHHTMTQTDINKLIVDKAAEGHMVVRLKGGDPFIFGRGGEEAEELYDAGQPVEVVPGVTSAIAVPAYAGIPLTHREHTSNVAFITGHEDPTKTESSLDWDKIATGIGTLVFLMGVKNLPNITSNLIKAGRDPETPAALIRWGTTPDQVSLIGTLNDIAEKAEAKGLRPPAILVVGEVVTLREKLNWFEKLPLFGRRILVTRTRTQASALSEKLNRLGAYVIECPTIKTVAPDDWQPADQALDNLADFDWLVLTSPNGVDYLMDRLKEKGRDARWLAPVKIAVIGPATAEKLGQSGITPDLVPDKFVAEGVIAAFSKMGVDGNKILLARAAVARNVLPVELTALGAEVTEVAMYQTVAPDDIPVPAKQALEAGEIDMITFTSSSTVTNMIELLGDNREAYLKDIKAASIGPITSATARDAGLNVDIEADQYTIDGLVEAIVDNFKPSE